MLVMRNKKAVKITRRVMVSTVVMTVGMVFKLRLSGWLRAERS